MAKKKILNLHGKGNFEEWFETIYESNFEGLYRFAFSITKSKPQAEDVVSEVFMKVWNHKPDSNNIEELKSYLYVSVKRLAIRMASMETHKISHYSSDLTLQLADTVNPENLLVGKELSDIIEEVTKGLSPHTSLVFDLVMNKGYSYREVADELGVSKRTAEKHMSNALQKLRSSLNKHLENERRSSDFLHKASSFTLITVLAGMCSILLK